MNWIGREHGLGLVDSSTVLLYIFLAICPTRQRFVHFPCHRRAERYQHYGPDRMVRVVGRPDIELLRHLSAGCLTKWLLIRRARQRRRMQ
ncbi:hypothetical protein PYCCODRAFT_1159362 [Trametes coccinea BRFM310]|uniref:Uncharacterized protein n=1 Tax=Trametes coccinea (strain BRFM310) TaxID=1353009 RepID=A0A1Y2IWU7_TRAC3|nr:hypothetical protein PYCCODRAFT_1159362 [Trametes coccinea BRFM310]